MNTQMRAAPSPATWSSPVVTMMSLAPADPEAVKVRKEVAGDTEASTPPSTDAADTTAKMGEVAGKSAPRERLSVVDTPSWSGALRTWPGIAPPIIGTAESSS